MLAVGWHFWVPQAGGKVNADQPAATIHQLLQIGYDFCRIGHLMWRKLIADENDGINFSQQSGVSRPLIGDRRAKGNLMFGGFDTVGHQLTARGNFMRLRRMIAGSDNYQDMLCRQLAGQIDDAATTDDEQQKPRYSQLPPDVADAHKQALDWNSVLAGNSGGMRCGHDEVLPVRLRGRQLGWELVRAWLGGPYAACDGS